MSGISISPVNASLLNAPTAAIVLTPQQSGTTFIVQKQAAVNTTVTLPDPSIAGLKYTFIMAQVAVVAETFNFTSPVTNTMVGFWQQVSGVATHTAQPVATTTVEFTATAEWNDSITLLSDGTYWHAQGLTGVAAGIAFA